MSRKKHIDLVGIIADFQKDLLHNKPTDDAMFEEVRMMRFKIRPLQGDVSLLNLKDKELIEILWNLGKLDEFFRQQKTRLDTGQKEVFFRFFDELYELFQTKLNTINLRSIREVSTPSTIEMEIFKEETRKRRAN